jgi:hypothetical protein
MSNNQVEIIKCLCGSTMAACVVEHMDGEWITNKKNYLKKGYTTHIVNAGDFQFAKCKCGDVQLVLKNKQLDLFDFN